MFGSERLTGALLDPLKRPTVRSIVCPCEAKGHDLAECVTFVAANFSPNQVQLVRHHGRNIERVREVGKFRERWVRDIRTGGDREAWRKGDFAAYFSSDACYRSQWYMLGNEHDAVCGFGVYGQTLYLDPIANMVIVKFSSQPRPVDEAMGENELRAFHAIGRALGEQA